MTIVIDAIVLTDLVEGVVPSTDTQDRIIRDLGPVMVPILKPYGILDNPLRACHFLAQAAHESDAFRTLEEYASGQAYENRHDLGNIHPGDGVRYKGRGIFQLTGRANYETIGKRLALDLVNRPDLAADPVNATSIAAIYWSDRHLNDLADRDDVVAVTKAINGGHNGLPSRQLYLRRAKAIFSIGPGGVVAGAAPSPTGVDMLATLGFAAPSNEAIRGFQAASGITVDGIVGPRTMAALRAAVARLKAYHKL